MKKIGIYALLLTIVACQQTPVEEGDIKFDIILSSGTLVDGQGKARIEADLAIKSGRIAAISTSLLSAENALQFVEVGGLVVAPDQDEIQRALRWHLRHAFYREFEIVN